MQRWWRVVATYRALALTYVVAAAAAGVPPYRHPVAGGAVLAVLVAWTVVVSAVSWRGARLPLALVGVDVATAVVAVLLTPLAVAHSDIARGAATLPGPWAAAPVLAAGVARGPAGGVLAGLLVAGADVIERGGAPANTVYGGLLLLVAGGMAGYVVRLAERAEVATAAAARIEAAAAERSRLARDIHDSVLQVLALVARRGADLGGEAAELGRLAGEQEVALRSLVATPLPGAEADGEVDLRALLEPLATARLTISSPATPVPLTRPVAEEVSAAVRVALANVEEHAGPAAQAWLLLEDDGDTVTVSVRDDGAGFAATRLDEAARAGRLGIAQSIVGRMQSIGGSAVVDSTPGFGTEVELRVPRR
ncbi:MAG: hypothetical protein QOC82_2902 [Frankiaceae bacterium]|nr:hypothetical protein [Frankiaceae bacterium]